MNHTQATTDAQPAIKAALPLPAEPSDRPDGGLHVLEWSQSSNGFHIQTLQASLKSGRDAFVENRRSDYVPLLVDTQDAVRMAADRLRSILELRKRDREREANPPMSLKDMMRDLTQAYPNLWKRPLSEFDARYAGEVGVWTGADQGAVMPDGLSFFDPLGIYGPPYVDGLHEGFYQWLKDRRWYCDRYDGATYFLLPDTKVDDPLWSGAALNLALMTAAPDDGSLPF